MTLSENLALRVFELAQAVRDGKVDALDVPLTDEYKELQNLSADVERRIGIDEMLNEILGVKVRRVQELARVLAAPEIYVNKLKDLSTRKLAGMIAYQRPITIAHLEPDSLETSMTRVTQFIDALSKDPPDEVPPPRAEIPDDFEFPTEDAVLLEDAERFAVSIPVGVSVAISDVISNDDFDEFLRRFLYVVILISKGILVFDAKTATVVRGP
ncbi:MAG: hypothetical protein ACFE7R_00450 [Candidatus Hodarchaeota archaeon]